MIILELPKDALLALTDVQLEQLIGRLSEADVVMSGAHVSDVRFSGSITAPDGGVDIRVIATKFPFVSGFIPRQNTIFQAKKSSMSAASITGEMKPKGTLANVIARQCDLGGAYVMVSLEDDCTEPMRTDRLTAMKAAVADHPNSGQIHLDFYDRFKLHQWLRQHPSIMVWVRTQLGQPLSGWQPYGRWSNVPHGMNDDLIMEPGVSVILPNLQHQKLTFEQAINPTRQLIAASQKAIRVAGLSGVGKTRFVQALFDDTVGENALDRTSVVYTDTGADPDPSARQMIDQLIQEGRIATVVVDNCPPDLHSVLADRVSSTGGKIKLLTVEYDIRDDRPLTTEVVHIEAHGPEIAEVLVLRRYPGIGQANARQVAEFSNGNTRIALALADRVEIGESLAILSDANLFDRLFQQRHQPDSQLRAQAEVLALVYSFSVEAVDGQPDELEVIGAFCGATPDQLYASVQIMSERQIVQKRSRWRAILPQAVANRLATSALNRIRIQTLRAIFEAPENVRLLKSFAHRLGLMHDHPVAQQIVSAWLEPDGMLTPVAGLDDDKARILDYVAPVCPEILLDRVEAEIMAPDFGGMEPRYNPRRTTILNMLVSLAYEPQMFDRCVRLLLRIAEQEDPANNYDAVRDKIVRFFQPYLSGTHASIEQRAAILREALWSPDPKLRALGSRMLSATLEGSHWTGAGMGDFGARPRDFGYRPNNQQLAAWRDRFISIAVEAGLDCDVDLSDRARSVMANEFRGMWFQAAIRPRLIDAAMTLNQQRAWTEGWKAVQSIIYFDHRAKNDEVVAIPIPQDLLELRERLAPTELLANIRTYLAGGRHDMWSLDPEFDHDDPEKYDAATARITQIVEGLGAEFSQASLRFDQIGKMLFSTNWSPYRHAFGVGLAKGSDDLMATWQEIAAALRASGATNFNCSVMSGFIEQAGLINQGIDRQILDECLNDPLLRAAIRILHPSHDFCEADLERCLLALNQDDVGAWTFGDILWRKEFAGLPRDKLLDLSQRLMDKPNGDDVVLDALSMKLHDTDMDVDTLGPDMRRVGLAAAIKRISRERDGNTHSTDHHMARVLQASLPREGNDDLKAEWLNLIFASVDARYGYGPDFDEAIQMTAASMPEEFLERVFNGDEEQREKRLFFLERGACRCLILDKTDLDRIINWCCASEDPAVWEGVATAVKVFVTAGDEKSVTLSDDCIRLLEACPSPDQVLNIYGFRIASDVTSDGRAASMERNLDALAVFTHHGNPEIAASATRMIADARIRVARERDRESREDEAREQTFE